MTRTGWLASIATAALVVALFAWLMQAIEWVDAEVPVAPRGEAARDRFYVAKQLTRQLGATVTTVRNFEQLPPPGATLVLGSHRWNMFPGREAALRRWISEGGHLVVLQSAWSAEGEPPPWVPMRSALPSRARRTGASAAAAGASASAATIDLVAAAAQVSGRCAEFFEPEGSDGAFGAPRRYRVCGYATRVLSADAPAWVLAGGDGAVAARVAYGRGDITGNALEGSFSNGALVRDDGALALAAMLQPHAGDMIWFFDEETRARFLAVLWDHGAPAILLAAAAIALLLWRGGTRFGPLLAERPRARRSIGEQVRRTAAFIAAGGGTALHRASVRALEEEARRSIPGYLGLLGARERGDAIALRTKSDPASLAAAMHLPPRPDRHRLAAAIDRLERARRALLPERGRRPQRQHSFDPGPP
jgi:hypothetical protein